MRRVRVMREWRLRMMWSPLGDDKDSIGLISGGELPRPNGRTDPAGP